jgi:hypothetical protein
VPLSDKERTRSRRTLRELLSAGRPALVAQLGEAQVGTLETAATEDLATLYEDAPNFRQGTNRRNFSYVLPGLAIYHALVERLELERQQALELVSAVVAAGVRRSIEDSPLTRVMLRLVARSRLAARLMERAMTGADEEGGWLATRSHHSQARVAFDVSQCGLVLYLRRAGAPELCRAFCDGDHVTAQYMDGLRFERTGTIADGAAFCDFRYYRSGVEAE